MTTATSLVFLRARTSVGLLGLVVLGLVILALLAFVAIVVHRDRRPQA